MKLPFFFHGNNFIKLLRPTRNNPFPGVIGTFMGRDAFRLAVSILGLKDKDVVLLPAYLCREVLKPFLGRCQVMFYEVQPDLSVDPEQIRCQLIKFPVKLVVLINYFGFLQPHRRSIHNICSQHGALLLEDCAHSLLTRGSGENGDLFVFSFRKHLPVPDGGGLAMKFEHPPRIPRFAPKIYANLLSILGTFKSLLAARCNWLSRSSLASRTSGILSSPNPASDNSSPRILPMSSFARNGIANAGLSKIVEQRRVDYLFWEKQICKGDYGQPVFPNLPPEVCPLGFPVMIRNRDAVQSRLEKVKIFLKIHWHLPKSVGPEFTTSHSLSLKIVTLPVYPELEPQECEAITMALKE